MILKQLVTFITIASMLLFPGGGDTGHNDSDNDSGNDKLVAAYSVSDNLYTYVSMSYDNHRDDNWKISVYGKQTELGDDYEYECLGELADNERSYVILIDKAAKEADYYYHGETEEDDTYNQFVMNLTKELYDEIGHIRADVSIAVLDDEGEITIRSDFGNGVAGGIDELTMFLESSLSSNELNADLDVVLEKAMYECKATKEGELVNIILITEDGASFDYEKLSEIISSNPDKLVNIITYKNENREGNFIDAGKLTKGYSETVTQNIHGDITSEAEVAERLLEYTESLVLFKFNIETISQYDAEYDIEIVISDEEGNELFKDYIAHVKNYSELRATDSDDSTDDFTDTGSTTHGGEGDANPDTEDTTDIIDDGADTQVEISDSDSAASNNSTDHQGGGQDNNDLVKTVLLIVIIASGAFAVIALLIMLIKKKKKVVKAPVKKGDGTKLAFEVVSGNCGIKAELVLYDEIVIGSDKNADIICADGKVAPYHARIIKKDGLLIIEDNKTLTGTYLEGMRIQKTNRVDSGDLLSVGDCEFIIRF